MHLKQLTQQSPSFYYMSALCTAYFKARGIKCDLIECEGKLPLLYTKGEIKLGGRLGLRGRLLRCELGAAQPSAYLHIGNKVYMNSGASVVAEVGIEIGDYSFIGDFVSIFDSNFHSIDASSPPRSAPVVIGSNVWLGSRTTVLPGSKIGDHTVVATGSIVRGDLPPRVLAAGNPAVPIKELDAPDGWHRK
jgi:acetyltransferase-like isoleucine patch superfamily enzyme